MQVRVLYFGALREMLARDSETLELPAAATVAQLIELCMDRAPQLRGFATAIAVAVNREYVGQSHLLCDGDEVALLPPVSGGAPDEALVRLQREPICPVKLLDTLKQGSDGAVVVFGGIVRDNSRGRKTLYLDYEAYEAMALQQMQNLAAQAKSQFAIREAALLHRLGRLEIGETSVWIAVASAHRAAAFDACRWIIDTLKTTVPIWKKEYFEDGAVWADGEPFPPEIAPHRN
jgi:molybdopterin synthase catalytic subunit